MAHKNLLRRNYELRWVIQCRKLFSNKRIIMQKPERTTFSIHINGILQIE